MKLSVVHYLLIFACLVSCDSNKPDRFVLEGEVADMPDSTALLLSYLTVDNDKWIEVNDTAYVLDGKFTFNGEISDLTAAFLEFDNTSLRLYLEPTQMTLKFDISRPWEYELSGSHAELENAVLREQLKSNEEKSYKELSVAANIIQRLNSQNEEISVRDSLLNILETNRAKRIAIGREIDKMQLDYILENKASKIAPDLIYLMARWGSFGLDTLKHAYDVLPADLKMTMPGRIAYKQIERSEKLIQGRDVTAGTPAPDFSATDITGKQIRLSDFYSQKYVLLDFWASWCKPCLEQTPQMKEIYRSYADKGLSIISISADENKAQWLNAVERFELGIWSHILSKADSADDYFAVDISDIFGVDTLPTYFLIDREGKVVARWDHIGEKQLAFIADIFNGR